MSSFIDLGEGRIQMPFGVLSGITTLQKSPSGDIESVTLNEKNVIVTHAGDLYAAYTETPRRKNKPSVEFYKNGLVKSVALEEQQEVTTPIGDLPAELVTFYESGELHRIFPVDGQLSGFWSEEDEKNQNIPLTFDLGFTRFTALLSSICFYKSGDIKSITLFPGETVTVETAFGAFSARHGFSMHQSGALRSFEPAAPVAIPTPVGPIVAFDPMSNGISADFASVILTEDGKISEISTVSHRILAQPKGLPVCWHKPVSVPHPCSDEKPFYQPMKLIFGDETVTVIDNAPHNYNINTCHFNVAPFSDEYFGCSPADCANCSLCGK